MLPDLILEQAQALGLELIAVTDHNSAENAAAMVQAAAGTGVTVLPGMEVQTREEVHLVCLFDTLEQVQAWQEEVYASLPRLKNKEEVFGAQVMLDAWGNPIGYNERLLLTSAALSVDEVWKRVSLQGGLCIPAHVDRPAYSLISNLGFIPPELGFVGVEISHLIGPHAARAKYPQLRGYSLVGNGDAHRLKELARRTTFQVAAPTVAELTLALAGESGRGVWVDGIGSGRVV